MSDLEALRWHYDKGLPKTPVLERLAQAKTILDEWCKNGHPTQTTEQECDEHVFVLLTLSDAAAMIKQLNWEVETICTILDKERKQPK